MLKSQLREEKYTINSIVYIALGVGKQMDEALVMQLTKQGSRVHQTTSMAPPAMKRATGILIKSNDQQMQKSTQLIKKIQNTSKQADSVVGVCNQVRLSFGDRRRENDELRQKIKRCKLAIGAVSKQTTEVQLELGAINSGTAFQTRRLELFSKDISELEELHQSTENVASQFTSVVSSSKHKFFIYCI